MEFQLNLINKAIASERKYGFSNLKGKTYYFAEFIRLQIHALSQTVLNESQQKDLKALAGIFRNYEDLTINERKQCLDVVEQLIRQIRQSKVKKDEPEASVKNVKPNSKLSELKVQYVKGIGPKLSEKLAGMGIFSVEDLLRYYPRKHLNYANCTKIRNAKVGETATVFGVIRKVDCFRSPKNKALTIIHILIHDNTGIMEACWFYRGASRWLLEQYKSKFQLGAKIVLSGTMRYGKYSKRIGMDKPEIELLDDNTDKLASIIIGKIVPVYSLVQGLDLKVLRKAINNALEAYKDTIIDYLPSYIKEKYNLLNLKKALSEFHFPTDMDSLKKARTRLVFDELFFIQLGLFYRRKQRELIDAGLNISFNRELVNIFLNNLPFKLTEAQNKVFNEIVADLRSDKPMNRLLQGDVGSGKTVVAFMALLGVIEQGYQGALMVPTEILAEQHYRTAIEWLTPLNVSVDLIIGDQTKKARKESLQRLVAGETHLVIGTHALIQEGVNFQKLGMIVIDEQHRFGVMQRSVLRSKGQIPGVLTMTATPIPRTLAITLHGDLDISVIDEMPPNRKPIETQIYYGKQKHIVWKFIKYVVSNRQQVYIVYPLIEESEVLDLQAATAEYENLKEIFPESTVGLLHGKMVGREKDRIMRDFINHRLDILVSTTVIEVGVDVPNSTVMVIENAERFGLAQLHQLRGRVGRGADKSYCFLLSANPSSIAKHRLEILTKTTNGFVIAEQDLRLRGPGEFLGTRQSGLPDLLLTDIVEDTVILDMARGAAKEVIDKDSNLWWDVHKSLKTELTKTFRHNLEFLEAS